MRTVFFSRYVTDASYEAIPRLARAMNALGEKSTDNSDNPRTNELEMTRASAPDRSILTPAASRFYARDCATGNASGMCDDERCALTLRTHALMRAHALRCNNVLTIHHPRSALLSLTSTTVCASSLPR